MVRWMATAKAFQLVGQEGLEGRRLAFSATAFVFTWNLVVSTAPVPVGGTPNFTDMGRDNFAIGIGVVDVTFLASHFLLEPLGECGVGAIGQRTGLRKLCELTKRTAYNRRAILARVKNTIGECHAAHELPKGVGITGAASKGHSAPTTLIAAPVQVTQRTEDHGKAAQKYFGARFIIDLVIVGAIVVRRISFVLEVTQHSVGGVSDG
ncbi:peptide/nickel transport system substrate-binding protein [Babesia caballi]|uniref:Peptide/nickel transport system substrate-binding protein n=1 Tax=Babesia caballi TaxID=5871 RepID=A0AAV4LQP1_BABCB|nr:peptide/nickel transport system substrate-binding protein [Babesia caballi]